MLFPHYNFIVRLGLAYIGRLSNTVNTHSQFKASYTFLLRDHLVQKGDLIEVYSSCQHSGPACESLHADSVTWICSHFKLSKSLCTVFSVLLLQEAPAYCC